MTINVCLCSLLCALVAAHDSVVAVAGLQLLSISHHSQQLIIGSSVCFTHPELNDHPCQLHRMLPSLRLVDVSPHKSRWALQLVHGCQQRLICDGRLV